MQVFHVYMGKRSLFADYSSIKSQYYAKNAKYFTCAALITILCNYFVRRASLPMWFICHWNLFLLRIGI